MFGKPLGSLSFRNNFKLPAGLLLGLDAIFLTKGYDENIYMALIITGVVAAVMLGDIRCLKDLFLVKKENITSKMEWLSLAIIVLIITIKMV